MISRMYKSKNELLNDFSGWREFLVFPKFSALRFDIFHYRIGDTVYSKDSKEAQDAFEKEELWHKLQGPDNLELLMKFGADIDDIKKRNRLKQMLVKVGMWT